MAIQNAINSNNPVPGQSGNTALGDSALVSSTADSFNTALGYNTLSAINGGSANTAIGSNALSSTTADSNNVAVGYNALNGLNGGSNNIAIGVGTLASLSAGSFNVAIGYNTLNSSQTDGQNIGIGWNTLTSCNGGSSNVAIGSQALSANGSGSTNIAIGGTALAQVLTGTDNIAVGGNAGINYVGAESNNIIIGTGVGGNPGDTGVTYIGTPSSTTSCYIQGIYGVTTVNTALPVLVDSLNGQLGTVSSSARYKENIQDMADVSSDILKLKPVTFNYKNDAKKTPQVGLIAEDVNEVMPDLVAYNKDNQIESVKYMDLIPLLLNELIKLKNEIEGIKSHI